MERRLLLSLFLCCIVIVVPLAVACTATPPPPTPAEEPSPATPPTSTEVFNWRWGATHMRMSSINPSMFWAFEEITQQSNGRLNIEPVLAETLGLNPQNAVPLLGKGVVEMYSVVTAAEGDVPIISIFEWPGIIPEENKILQWEIYEALVPYLETELMAQGIVRIGGCMWPGRRIWTVKELESPYDLKGLLIRSSSAGDSIVIEALGATPVSIPFVETEMALRRGTVDGLATTTEAIAALQVQDAIKTAVLTKHGGTHVSIVVSKTYWDKLPADLQKLLKDIVWNALKAYTWTTPVTQYTLEREFQEQYGMKMLELPPELKEAINKAGRDNLEDWYVKTGPVGREIVDLIDRMIAEAGGF